MTKKHFIALADSIIKHNSSKWFGKETKFSFSQINSLADFCQSQNSEFKRDRWIAYINGECGQNGGAR